MVLMKIPVVTFPFHSSYDLKALQKTNSHGDYIIIISNNVYIENTSRNKLF